MNSGKIYRLAATITVASFLTACASSGGYSSSDNSGYGYSKKAKTEEVKKTVTVNITNFTFNPPSISVSPGDTIVFVNQDSAPHTATSDAGVFDTGTLANGQSGSITIAEAGQYEYFCSIHPAMKGSIVVE